MIIQVKQGLGIPTAISEIMREKAAATVAQIRKIESLLAGAVVAGCIVLGGIACQDNNGGGGEVEDGSGINPNDSIPLIDTTITDTTKVDTTKADTSKTDEFAEYKVFMGDIFIVGYATSITFTASDTIGWAKVYSKNGWATQGPTYIAVELPNGIWATNAIVFDYRLFDPGWGSKKLGDLGYDLYLKGIAWREPQLDKAKLDAKKPDEQGL